MPSRYSAMSISEMPRLLPRSPAIRRARRAVSACGAVRSLLIASSALCIGIASYLPVPPDEQIADRRAEDAGGIALVYLARPDPVRAGVDEGDASRHQPGNRQVGAERAVRLAARQQRADRLVRGLMCPRDCVRGQQF